MKEKKIDAKLQEMKLAKLVREFARLNNWQMYQRMGKKTVQSYLSFERSAKRMTLEDFYLLEKIWIESGGSKEGFEDLARKCSKK